MFPGSDRYKGSVVDQYVDLAVDISGFGNDAVKAALAISDIQLYGCSASFLQVLDLFQFTSRRNDLVSTSSDAVYELLSKARGASRDEPYELRHNLSGPRGDAITPALDKATQSKLCLIRG